MQNLAKKGNMGAGVAFVVSFAVLIIVVVVAALIIQGVQDSTAAGTAARNATVQGLTGITNFTSLLGVLGTVGIAVVVIGLVIGGLAFGQRQ